MNRPMAKPTPDAPAQRHGCSPSLDDARSREPRGRVQRAPLRGGRQVALEGEGGLVFFVVESGEALGRRSRRVSRRRSGRATPPSARSRSSTAAHAPRRSRPSATHRLRTAGLRLPAVRRGAPAGRLEAARGDGRPARSRRVCASRAHRASAFPELTRSSSALAGSPESATVSAPAIAARRGRRRRRSERRPPHSALRRPRREPSLRPSSRRP